MYIAEDGTVRHDDGKCISCGACVWNCPYGAVSFSKTKGVSQKCEACYVRREKGQAPACVAACITYSLKFGKLDEISEESTVRTLPILPSPEQTKPSTIINVPKDLNNKFLKHQKGGQYER
jgi:anaerobic dimethyl sulfoxide reductase subunit B (iron-sulfur subunit)